MLRGSMHTSTHPHYPLALSLFCSLPHALDNLKSTNGPRCTCPTLAMAMYLTCSINRSAPHRPVQMASHTHDIFQLCHLTMPFSIKPRSKAATSLPTEHNKKCRRPWQGRPIVWQQQRPNIWQPTPYYLPPPGITYSPSPSPSPSSVLKHAAAHGRHTVPGPWNSAGSLLTPGHCSHARRLGSQTRAGWSSAASRSL